MKLELLITIRIITSDSPRTKNKNCMKIIQVSMGKCRPRIIAYNVTPSILLCAGPTRTP